MNPIITEQIDKFKTGDFSRYESFYNETVQTVYTMIQTIVEDPNAATSLVPRVYDKIYQNIASLEWVERFYQWVAAFVNEEALGFLRENHQIEVATAVPGYEGTATDANIQSGAAQAEMTEQIYDYAVEDEMLTIAETEVADTFLITKLQEIVQTLSPIERVMFQEYYYFGAGVPDIAAKTGSHVTDVRHSLSRTRTSILQAITETPAYAANYGNPNVRRYTLSEIPWIWMIYQNFLGYTLGIDMVSIAGWSLGVLGQAVGGMTAVGGAAGGAIAGVEGVAGTVGTGSAAVAGGTSAAAGSAAAVAGGASGASGIAAGILGTVGGKIAIGAIGAALATGIGFGAHHVITANRTTTEIASTAEPGSETTVATTEEASETTEAATEAVTEDATVERYKAYYAVVQQYMEEHPTKVEYYVGIYAQGFLCAQLVDFNHNGEEQLLLTYMQDDTGSSAGAYMIDLYDYADGEAVLRDTITGNREYFFSDLTDQTAVCTCSETYPFDISSGAINTLYTTLYTYQDGKLQPIHTYEEKDIFGETGCTTYISIDGETQTEEAYAEAYPTAEDLYYVYALNTSSYDPTVMQVLMRTLIRKHETILKLAQMSQDDAFLNNEATTVFSTVDALDDGQFTVSSGKNKYNEEYYIAPGGTDFDLSADGQTIHVQTDAGIRSYSDYCITNIDDTPVIVGGNNFAYNWDSWMWVQKEDYLSLAQDSLYDCGESGYMFDEKCRVSEEEYNANVNALMQ